LGLAYENLDGATRAFMIEEIAIDERAETLYRSPWLTQGGQGDWAEILRDAATNGSDDTLAAQLRLRNRIVARAQRRKPNSHAMTWQSRNRRRNSSAGSIPRQKFSSSTPRV
jgi:hypothetical protein